MIMRLRSMHKYFKKTNSALFYIYNFKILVYNMSCVVWLTYITSDFLSPYTKFSDGHGQRSQFAARSRFHVLYFDKIGNNSASATLGMKFQTNINTNDIVVKTAVKGIWQLKSKQLQNNTYI